MNTDGEQEILLEAEAITITTGGAVSSVNGQTGDVVLTTSDLENTSDYQTGDEVTATVASAIEAETTARQDADSNLQGQIDAIDAVIPNQATASNQLADKDFVNSSVATNTAYYISDNGQPFTSVAALEAYSGTLTNNDYAFVTGTDAQGNTFYDRYKYNADTGEWAFEYELNNSSFTAVQWAAINSGITSGNVSKLNALANIQTIGANLALDANGELSATDTTYSDFTGTDGTTAGTAGLVPAPATTDAGKFLKADGTWEELGAGGGVTELTSDDYNWPVGNPTSVALWLLGNGDYYVADASVLVSMTSTLLATQGMYTVADYDSSSKQVLAFALPDGVAGIYRMDNTTGVVGSSQTFIPPAVVQATGASTANVMSQKAVTSMVYADPATKYNINIGGAGNPTNGGAVLLFGNSGSTNAIAIGTGSNVQATGGIALGAGAQATSTGEMNIGTLWTSNGYNSSNYRLLTGLYDPQSDHDAATKGYTDSLVVNYATLNGSSAPTTSTAGEYVGQLYYDTTNDQMYYLSAIDDTVTPTEYTWSTFGGVTLYSTVLGTNTDGAPTQNAVAEALFNDPDTGRQIKIGDGASSAGTRSIAIGSEASAVGNRSISIGQATTTGGNYNVCIGSGTASGGYAVAIGSHTTTISGATASGAVAIGNSTATAVNSVAIGSNASASVQGQFDIGSTVNSTGGYNSSAYRLLTGVYDAQNAHDAVNLQQLTSRVLAGGTTAPTTATVGTVGALYAYVESGTGHLAICTDVTGSTYTWQTLV